MDCFFGFLFTKCRPLLINCLVKIQRTFLDFFPLTERLSTNQVVYPFGIFKLFLLGVRVAESFWFCFRCVILYICILIFCTGPLLVRCRYDNSVFSWCINYIH